MMDMGSNKGVGATSFPLTLDRVGPSTAKALRNPQTKLETEDAVEASTALNSPAQGTTRGQVDQAVASIQEFAQSVRRNLNFSVDEDSGRVVVKVTDSDSGDVIRQIPSEEALQLAENLQGLSSVLFKAEA